MGKQGGVCRSLGRSAKALDSGGLCLGSFLYSSGWSHTVALLYGKGCHLGRLVDTSQKSARSRQTALERVETAMDCIKLDKDRVAIDQEMHLGSFR